MKIVADANIPYIKGRLEEYGEVTYVPTEEIDAAAVKEADILFVRTPTKCRPALLEGSRCRFIATASCGFDHIDTEYCAAHSIEWRNAPGCNAPSVAQYILASLLLYMDAVGSAPEKHTVGIIGAGHVGSAVAATLRKVGFNLLLNDPPRAEAEGADGFVPLSEIEEKCDIITLHTPLIKEGAHPTRYLADAEFFSRLKRKPLFINAARGGVADDKAVLEAKHSGQIRDFIIDCWENEPAGIYLPLMDEAFIATPHIAGYSDDGKAVGSYMSLCEVARYCGGKQPDMQYPSEPDNAVIDLATAKNPLLAAVLHSYDPRNDFARLKKAPDSFEALRNNYPFRREYNAYRIQNAPKEYAGILENLGFGL